MEVAVEMGIPIRQNSHLWGIRAAILTNAIGSSQLLSKFNFPKVQKVDILVSQFLFQSYYSRNLIYSLPVPDYSSTSIFQKHIPVHTRKYKNACL